MSYKNAVEFVANVFHGDALEYFSKLMETAVTKYDRFMKDLHLSLIKYVENAWNRITNAIFEYWQRFLQRIEPTILKIAQYLETVLWNISNEVFGMPLLNNLTPTTTTTKLTAILIKNLFDRFLVQTNQRNCCLTIL